MSENQTRVVTDEASPQCPPPAQRPAETPQERDPGVLLHELAAQLKCVRDRALLNEYLRLRRGVR